LSEDYLVHGHAHPIEPLIKSILVVFQFINLGSHFVAFVIDLQQKLLDFAHHVIHRLLLPPQMK
jgi:hypothetical protein